MAKKVVRIQSDHHVHFDSAIDGYGKNNDILLKKLDDDTIEVHLGFLQFNYKYDVVFPVEKEFLKLNKEDDLILIKNTELSNIVCCMQNADNLITFTIKYTTAVEDKKLIQNIDFKVNNSTRIISFILKSTVIGAGRGTPLLKNGIHCIGIVNSEVDSDSDKND